MIMVVAVVVVMMAFIRIDSLLCLPSSKKLSNLAQRAQYLRLTIAGAPEISRHLSNLCTRWACLSLGWILSKKVICWYCAHLFWEAIVEQLSKRVGHHFAKAFLRNTSLSLYEKLCAETIHCQSSIWTTQYIHSILLPQKKLYFPYFQALRGHCFFSFEFYLSRQRRYTA